MRRLDEPSGRRDPATADSAARKGDASRVGRRRSRALTDHEVDRIAGGLPGHINVKEAAALARVSPSTIHHRVARGAYAGAVIRGRPLLFNRDAFIRAVHRAR